MNHEINGIITDQLVRTRSLLVGVITLDENSERATLWTGIIDVLLSDLERRIKEDICSVLRASIEAEQPPTRLVRKMTRKVTVADSATKDGVQ